MSISSLRSAWPRKGSTDLVRTCADGRLSPSLTEIVLIIGRATRDAEGKSRARFTNLIAEPDASEEVVREAVNDTLKAIAASLLMEQVLDATFQLHAEGQSPGRSRGSTTAEAGEIRRSAISASTRRKVSSQDRDRTGSHSRKARGRTDRSAT